MILGARAGLWGAVFCIVLGLAACQHKGVLIQEAPFSLTEIRKVVVSVIGEPRRLSPNGYELVSHYFDREEEIIERPNEVRQRFHTVVTILGDRRPYDIEVQVIVEIRTLDGYENVGVDERMASRVADRIKKALHESREKRNFIDDFKAF